MSHELQHISDADSLSWEDLRKISDYTASRVINEIQKRYTPAAHHTFLIPNTWVGRIVKWVLKRYLNRVTYKLRYVGRTPKVKGARRYHPYGMPVSKSKYIAIYIDPRKPFEP